MDSNGLTGTASDSNGLITLSCLYLEIGILGNGLSGTVVDQNGLTGPSSECKGLITMTCL